jgi:hypothetical protein
MHASGQNKGDSRSVLQLLLLDIQNKLLLVSSNLRALRKACYPYRGISQMTGRFQRRKPPQDASGGHIVRRQRQVHGPAMDPPDKVSAIQLASTLAGRGLATIHSHLTGYGQSSLREIQGSRPRDAAEPKRKRANGLGTSWAGGAQEDFQQSFAQSAETTGSKGGARSVAAMAVRPGRGPGARWTRTRPWRLKPRRADEPSGHTASGEDYAPPGGRDRVPRR